MALSVRRRHFGHCWNDTLAESGGKDGFEKSDAFLAVVDGQFLIVKSQLSGPFYRQRWFGKRGRNKWRIKAGDKFINHLPSLGSSLKQGQGALLSARLSCFYFIITTRKWWLWFLSRRLVRRLVVRLGKTLLNSYNDVTREPRCTLTMFSYNRNFKFETGGKWLRDL